MPAQPSSPGELPQNLVLSRVLMAFACLVSCCRLLLLVGFEAGSAEAGAAAGAAAWAGQGSGCN